MKILVELKKVFSFKNIVLLALVCFVPWLFSFLIVTNNSSVSISGKFNSYTFSFTIWELMKILFVSILIPIFVTSSNMGKELSNKSIYMYITKVSNTYYYNIKLLANYIYSILLIILYLISSTISFNLILRKSEHFSQVDVSREIIIYTILLTIFEIMLYVSLTHLLSIYFNQLGSLFLSFIIIITIRIIKNVPSIKKYTPEEICDFLRIMKIKHEDLFQDFMFSATYILSCIIVIYTLGYISIKYKEFR